MGSSSHSAAPPPPAGYRSGTDRRVFLAWVAALGALFVAAQLLLPVLVLAPLLSGGLEEVVDRPGVQQGAHWAGVLWFPVES